MQLSPVTFAVNLECVSGQTTPEPRDKRLLRMSYVLVVNGTNAQDPFSNPFFPPLVVCPRVLKVKSTLDKARVALFSFYAKLIRLTLALLKL